MTKSIDRSEIENLIKQGATLADIAAQMNTSWDSAQKTLRELNITPPFADPRVEGPSSLLGLIPVEHQPASAEDLVAQLDYPAAGFAARRVDPVAIYQHFHGQQFLDQYTGEDVGRTRLTLVNPPLAGHPPNMLITNITALAESTIKKRFSDWMPNITEKFLCVAPGVAIFELYITRPYDTLVGGTYSKAYIDATFDRWVGTPYVQHSKSDQEVERVLPVTPFEIAWWAWIQITHFGLLKGLSELRVNVGGVQAVLTDQQMVDFLLSYHMKDASGIVLPGSNGQKSSIIQP